MPKAKPKYKDERWLRKQYQEKGKTMKEIANLTKVCSDTICRWLNKLDIKTRDQGSNSNKPKRYVLWDDYWNKGLTLRELGEKNDVSYERVRQWLAKLGLDKSSFINLWQDIHGWSEQFCEVVWSINKGKEGLPRRIWELDKDYLKSITEKNSLRGVSAKLDLPPSHTRKLYKEFFEDVRELFPKYPKSAERFTGECVVCGKKIERKVSCIKERGWYKGDGPGPFCSKECMGKWLGGNYGFGKDKEKE